MGPGESLDSRNRYRGSITRRKEQAWETFYSYLHTKSSEFSTTKRYKLDQLFVGMSTRRRTQTLPKGRPAWPPRSPTHRSSLIILSAHSSPPRKNWLSEFL
jgi:hypothetical protein